MVLNDALDLLYQLLNLVFQFSHSFGIIVLATVGLAIMG